MHDYWHKQGSEPLFANLVWSRPETKHSAGKLLIIGGHAQSFAAPAEAFVAADNAGIGVARVLLPDSLVRTVSKLFPAAEFAPSNPSGGFKITALAELLAASLWADGVLLAGDLGRNSETIAMLENFAGKYDGPLVITKDAADAFCEQPASLVERSATTLVISTAQLQRLATSLSAPRAFTSDFGLVQAADWLREFTNTHTNLYVITQHQGNFIVAVEGQVSTTPTGEEKVWRTKTAATAATWWLQTPDKPFEALTTAILNPKH